ncbi:hypothetical protein BsWGS_26992 [Bradybaena similaris]
MHRHWGTGSKAEVDVQTLEHGK